MPVPDSDPKDGDRYVVASAFAALVSVQFAAPCSGGDRRGLPAGLEFAVWGDPVPGATALTARPLEAARWTPLLVSAEDLEDPLYGGYALIIDKADLASHCRSL